MAARGLFSSWAKLIDQRISGFPNLHLLLGRLECPWLRQIDHVDDHCNGSILSRTAPIRMAVRPSGTEVLSRSEHRCRIREAAQRAQVERAAFVGRNLAPMDLPGWELLSSESDHPQKMD